MHGSWLPWPKAVLWGDGVPSAPRCPRPAPVCGGRSQPLTQPSPPPQSWTLLATCSPAPSRTRPRALTSLTWPTRCPNPARSGRTVKPPRLSSAPPPPRWSTWTRWWHRRRPPRRATRSCRVGAGLSRGVGAGWECGAAAVLTLPVSSRRAQHAVAHQPLQPGRAAQAHAQPDADRLPGARPARRPARQRHDLQHVPTAAAQQRPRRPARLRQCLPAGGGRAVPRAARRFAAASAAAERPPGPAGRAQPLPLRAAGGLPPLPGRSPAAPSPRTAPGTAGSANRPQELRPEGSAGSGTVRCARSASVRGPVGRGAAPGGWTAASSSLPFPGNALFP